MLILRHYAQVNGRRVHYRRSGSGPCLVLIHESPQSSFVLEPLIRRLSHRFTVIAPDTPGAGESESIGTSPDIGAYASSLGETLRALGIERTALYGSHTGAKIALELALRDPRRVSGVVIQGLGIYGDDERRTLLENYAPSLAPESDGTHLVRAWNIRRDMYLFWPWFDRTEKGRLPMDIPADDQLHDVVVDFLRSGEGWDRTYRAAFQYDPREPLARIGVPTMFLGVDGDPLADLGARVSPLSSNVELRRVPWNLDVIASEVARFAADPGDLAPPPDPPRVMPERGAMVRDYARSSAGETLFRASGRPEAGDPIFLFQASPYSGAVLEPLISSLSIAAGDRLVVAFDSPGNGDSTPLPRVASIADLAEGLAAAVEWFGAAEFDLYGTHTGALVAIELGLRWPQRAKHLILDGISAFPKDVARDLVDHYAPAMETRTDGSHLIWAWSMLRDQSLFFPHHRRVAQFTKRGYPLPPPPALHRNFMEFIKGGRTYHWNYRAAFAYETLDRYARLAVPTLLTSTAHDPLRSHLDLARAVRPDIETRERPASYPDAAREFASFLAR